MTVTTGSGPWPAQNIDRIVSEHGVRGAALHVRLRVVLVVFALATVLWAPPDYYAELCRWLAIGYVVWAVAIAVWFRLDPAHLVRMTWLVLTADLLLFGVLSQLAGVSDRLSWTAYILSNGFLLIPLLAAAQLRPLLGMVIGTGTTGLYLLSSISARQFNGTPGTDGEPWSSVVLRTLVVAGVSAGAVLLSVVQRSRVAEIALLAAQRADLLGELTDLEDRQRRDLAEALHDGALQYLLGARLELEEARDTGDTDSFDRVDEALVTSAKLLRSTVSELHPAVLAQAGLAQALRDLAANTQIRGHFGVTVAIDAPDDGRRDPSDLLLYSVAREMLNNVVKHAQATHVSVELTHVSGSVTLRVTDDGRGIADGELDRQLAAGHIGVASHRLRVEAAGGVLTLSPADPHGTVATVVLPTGTSDERPGWTGRRMRAERE